jgi:hypothetical protein
MKSLLAGALALAMPCAASNAPAPPPETTNELALPSPFRGSFEVVPKIECVASRGSGVRISDDIVITAAHVVVEKGPCGIDGKPTEIVYNEPGQDFTAIRVNLGRGLRAIVSCEGIIAGQRYYAYGYAFGGKPNVEPLIGTNYKHKDGTVKLRGRVFKGMSGGMVANEEGAFVAITVMLNEEVDWAYVVPLSETYLCAG